MNKTRRILFLITLLMLQPFSYASILANKVQAFTQAFIQTKPVKGIIYGMWINGRPVIISALGESMTNVLANRSMYFRIGGVTQTMLSTMLMQLVERRVVSLDDKVSRWFPYLPNANLVTLQMLSNGTSGYPDYVFNTQFQEASTNQIFKEWTVSELLSYAFMEPVLFPPNTSQHYSHTDSVILGAILSQATQTPFNLLLNSLIFRPLGLNNTAFSLTATMPSPTLHAFSSARNVYEDSTFWNPSWTSYSGSMFSTIYDLGVWANAWMQGVLISPSSTKILRAPLTVGKGNNTANLYFAMNFVYANHWLIQNPSFGGYSGIFAVLPERNIVFIAFNTINEGDNSNINYSFSLWQALAAYLVPEFAPPIF